MSSNLLLIKLTHNIYW